MTAGRAGDSECRWSGLAFIHFAPYVLPLDRFHGVLAPHAGLRAVAQARVRYRPRTLRRIQPSRVAAEPEESREWRICTKHRAIDRLLGWLYSRAQSKKKRLNFLFASRWLNISGQQSNFQIGFSSSHAELRILRHHGGRTARRTVPVPVSG